MGMCVCKYVYDILMMTAVNITVLCVLGVRVISVEMLSLLRFVKIYVICFAGKDT